MFLGPEWSPEWVEIISETTDRNAALEDLLGIPVLPGCGIPCIAIETAELHTAKLTQVEPSQTICYSDLPVLMGVVPPRKVEDMVGQTISLQLLNGLVLEESVAENLSMSRRTMQRRLQSEGTTFREIKARCLVARARSLLSESSLEIQNVSRALGYEEPNSFQRAFKSWTGLTPQVYRTNAVRKN
jgi:AraC-like DNA-binding protein